MAIVQIVTNASLPGPDSETLRWTQTQTSPAACSQCHKRRAIGRLAVINPRTDTERVVIQRICQKCIIVVQERREADRTAQLDIPNDTHA